METRGRKQTHGSAKWIEKFGVNGHDNTSKASKRKLNNPKSSVPIKKSKNNKDKPKTKSSLKILAT